MGNWLIKVTPTGSANPTVRWQWQASDERSRATFGLMGRRGMGFRASRELAEKSAKLFVDEREAAMAFLYTPTTEA